MTVHRKSLSWVWFLPLNKTVRSTNKKLFMLLFHQKVRKNDRRWSCGCCKKEGGIKKRKAPEQ
jgi:hypothetical protein